MVPPLLQRTLLVRGMVLWLLTRIMARAALGLAGSALSGPLLLPSWTVLMTAVLIVVDLRRRGELVLLHNLGITTSRAVFVAMVPVAVMEVAIAILVA